MTLNDSSSRERNSRTPPRHKTPAAGNPRNSRKIGVLRQRTARPGGRRPAIRPDAGRPTHARLLATASLAGHRERARDACAIARACKVEKVIACAVAHLHTRSAGRDRYRANTPNARERGNALAGILTWHAERDGATANVRRVGADQPRLAPQEHRIARLPLPWTRTTLAAPRRRRELAQGRTRFRRTVAGLCVRRQVRLHRASPRA
jgi:hypothetical protein